MPVGLLILPEAKLRLQFERKQCCLSLPALLSSVTIIVPSAGVCAHSAGVIVIGTAADAPFGSVTKSPWLIELEYALYSPSPATTSTKLLVTSKPNA